MPRAATATTSSKTRTPAAVSLDVPAGQPAAAELRDALARALARGKSGARVTVGTIGFPDAAVLQVLCAAHRQAVKRGAPFEIAGDGAGSVAYLAELCGLTGPSSCGLADGATCPWTQTADR